MAPMGTGWEQGVGLGGRGAEGGAPRGRAGTWCGGLEGRGDAEPELELAANCAVPNYRERANHRGASESA